MESDSPLLLEPATYASASRSVGVGASAQSVEMIQTHLSHVYLVGDLVFKFKRNVQYEFVDQRTVQSRVSLCERELEANSNPVLTSNVYLGMGRLTRTINGHEVSLKSSRGEPCIVMRRLNDDFNFDRLLASCTADIESSELVEVSDMLKKGFTRVVDDFPEYDLQKRVSDNFETPSAVVTDSEEFAALRRDTLKLCAGVKPPFVDGHGDLKAEHIYRFNDRLVVIDRVEFKDEFRLSPCRCLVQDVATLVVDLRFRGRYDLAREFAELFDDIPTDLLRLFVAYRAAVKAKVSALRKASLQTQRACWNVARSALYPKRVGFVVVVSTIDGKPGCGKSTLARGLRDVYGASVIGTDSVRSDLNLCGKYDDESKEKVYRKAFDLIAETSGRVVVEGNFPSKVFDYVRRSLVELGLPFASVVISCSDSEARRRVCKRHDDDLTEVRSAERFDRILAKLNSRTNDEHDALKSLCCSKLTLRVDTTVDEPDTVLKTTVAFLTSLGIVT